jgi:ADP-ribose pyrophosphatase YjhB (NUDIX family)
LPSVTKKSFNGSATTGIYTLSLHDALPILVTHHFWLLKEIFRFCPRCASPNVSVERERRVSCLDCGLVYFHNNAAATGCIISTNAGIVFVERQKPPAKGKLGLPGGFVDPGEDALLGARRECIEEIGWDPGENLRFLASFPNVYPYKDVVYHTCDLYFSVSAPELTMDALKPDPRETATIRFIQKDRINLEDIAFDAARKAVLFFMKRSAGV